MNPEQFPNPEHNSEHFKEKAVEYSKEFARQVHGITEEAIAKYNERHPNDIFTVHSVEEYMKNPTIHMEGDRITFECRGITHLMLRKQNNQWVFDSFRNESMNTPEEVVAEINDELYRVKDSFADQFNKLIA